MFSHCAVQMATYRPKLSQRPLISKDHPTTRRTRTAARNRDWHNSIIPTNEPETTALLYAITGRIVQSHYPPRRSAPCWSGRKGVLQYPDIPAARNDTNRPKTGAETRSSVVSLTFLYCINGQMLSGWSNRYSGSLPSGAIRHHAASGPFCTRARQTETAMIITTP